MSWVGEYGDGSTPIPQAVPEPKTPEWRMRQYRLQLAPQCNYIPMPVHPAVQLSVAIEDGDPFLYVFADVNQEPTVQLKVWVVVDDAIVSVGGDNFLLLLGTVTQRMTILGGKGDTSVKHVAYHIFKEYP